MNEPRLQIEATITIDGETKASIFGYSMESFEEKLGILQNIEDKFNLGDYDEF